MSETQSGLRTERVVIEVTMPASHKGTHAETWPWKSMLGMWGFGYSPGESVRVVDTHAERAERILKTLAADRFAAAVTEADTLRARVVELEAQVADCNVIIGGRWREAVCAVAGKPTPVASDSAEAGSQ